MESSCFSCATIGSWAAFFQNIFRVGFDDPLAGIINIALVKGVSVSAVWWWM